MRLTATSSPHIHGNDSVRITMGDVLILLVPVTVIAVYYYGMRALTMTLISCVSSVALEYLYRRLLGHSKSIGDLSAVITGAYIAFNMPVTAPLWYPVIGSFFAVVVVKQLFGGIGRNIFNPAAAGIAFLTVAWPGIMTAFPLPFGHLPLFATPHGFQTGRTALAALKSGILPDNYLYEMMIGYTPGNLGTACILIILIGGLYLLYRRIINWQIPVSFLGAVALVALIFPRCPSGRLDSVLYELCSGSLLFAAVFMATDPVTSPVTSIGRLIFGFCCGLLTALIRYFGLYPEGAYFAVLFMNPFVLALDRLSWKLRVKGGRLLYAKES